MFSYCFARGLVQNPELGKTANGTPVINFDLIVNREANGKRYRNRFRVTCFGPEAWKYKKWDGRIAFVFGRLQTEYWEDVEHRKRSATKIVLINGWVESSSRAFDR